jgi:hypothetical protein
MQFRLAQRTVAAALARHPKVSCCQARAGARVCKEGAARRHQQIRHSLVELELLS